MCDGVNKRVGDNEIHYCSGRRRHRRRCRRHRRRRYYYRNTHIMLHNTSRRDTRRGSSDIGVAQTLARLSDAIINLVTIARLRARARTCVRLRATT